jgi:hypothetical protein
MLFGSGYDPNRVLGILATAMILSRRVNDRAKIQVPYPTDEGDLVFDTFEHRCRIIAAQAWVGGARAVEHAPIRSENACAVKRPHAEWNKDTSKRLIDPRRQYMVFAEHLEGASPVGHKPTAVCLTISIDQQTGARRGTVFLSACATDAERRKFLGVRACDPVKQVYLFRE